MLCPEIKTLGDRLGEHRVFSLFLLFLYSFDLFCLYFSGVVAIFFYFLSLSSILSGCNDETEKLIPIERQYGLLGIKATWI